MNLHELEARLVERGIDPRWYSFSSPQEGERYCLIHRGFHWEVFYAERGQESGLKIFSGESQAASYFFNGL